MGDHEGYGITIFIVIMSYHGSFHPFLTFSTSACCSRVHPKNSQVPNRQAIQKIQPSLSPPTAGVMDLRGDSARNTTRQGLMVDITVFIGVNIYIYIYIYIHLLDIFHNMIQLYIYWL